MGTTGGHGLSIIYSSLSRVSVKMWLKDDAKPLKLCWRLDSPYASYDAAVENQNPLPSTHHLSQQQGKTDLLRGLYGPTPSCVVTEAPGSSFTLPRAAGGETQATGSCTQRSASPRHGRLSEGHSSSPPSELPCLLGACTRTFTLSQGRFSCGWFYIYSQQPSS